MTRLGDLFPAGVITGQHVIRLYRIAQEMEFAIPAVNCTSSSVVNAVLEAARDAGSPVIVQISHGGAQFFAGKGISNKDEKASVAGSVAGALHVRAMAEHYGVPVVLHSDHCAKKILKWFDGMLEADKAYFKQHGEPLFSSHMLDLSEEPIDENIAICKKYLSVMKPMNLLLELELGITGGEEDGVDNTGVDNASLYSQPEDILKAYKELTPISSWFTIAAAFGNVHGVYKAGNVKLHPELLGKFQAHVVKETGVKSKKPVLFVFHGGSGSTKEEES